MKSNIKAPVLLIAFNRPDTTQIVFDSIREIKPQKLYVSIDGPRSDKSGETDLCQQVIDITKNIDWECEAKYLIQNQNLGCRLGVTTAITWALNNEDRIIIIEDDIVAVPAFFYFADEMLEKYKNAENIAMISANNYTPVKTSEEDFFFSMYGHIWGWATWKHVWERFEDFHSNIDTEIEYDYQRINYNSISENKYFTKYFKYVIEKVKDNSINAWGPQFVLFRFRFKLLSIVPRVNLASNIGVDSSRTDTIGGKDNNYFPADYTFTYKLHPNKIECNLEYDKYHFKKHIDKKETLLNRAFNKIRRILN